MKRESIMMLIAGVVLGAVLGFIGTRQYYAGKAAQAPAPPPAAPAQAAPAAGASPAGQESFDPKEHEAMLAQIKAEVDKDPKNVEQRVLLANILYDAGKFDQAAPYYEQVLKLDPNNTDVMVDLGVSYRNLHRYDDALVLFQRALKIQPDKKQALFNVAIVYGLDKKDKVKAQEALKQFQEKYPDEPAGKMLADELAKH
jgi:cytochrome c-type biogenesis protein CcmH/NrfG